MKAIFTGGGTGGHIYPSLSLAEKLKDEYNFEIIYLGSPASMEERIMQEKGLPFLALKTEGFTSKNPVKVLRVLLKLFRARKEAVKILQQEKPLFVFATGGYVSAPLALAAKKMKIPLFLHEQNSIPGLTNKITSRFAKIVFTTFSGSQRYFPATVKTINSGLPVRKEFQKINLEKAREDYQTDKFKKTILITGGSGGALFLNKSALSLYNWAIENNVQLIHVTGKRDFSLIIKEFDKMRVKSSNIKILPYLNDMHEVLAIADLTISRAGASFLAEMTYLGKTGLVIPFPFAANNHQFENAKELAEKGAFLILEEKMLEKDPQILKDTLAGLLADQKKIMEMEKKSAQEGQHNTLETIVENIFKETGVVL